MLQEYDFLLQHIPGKMNTKADILLRLFRHNPSEDNKNIKMFKDKLLIQNIVKEPEKLEATMLENRNFVVKEDDEILTKI